MSRFSYPKTAEEWWILFDENKDAMRNMVASFHPVRPLAGKKFREFTGTISAGMAEFSCQLIRKEIAD